MKHFGMALDLKSDPKKIKEYRRYHEDPWPEPLKGLCEIGVKDMKIFLLGTHLFMYMTTNDAFDLNRDFPSYIEQNPKAAEWDELMRTFQQRVPEAGQEEWWASMELVFDLHEHV